MTSNEIPPIVIVRPSGSTRGKSSSLTSEPITATYERCSFSISVKKRPDSRSRFRISLMFDVVPWIWTSERR